MGNVVEPSLRRLATFWRKKRFHGKRSSGEGDAGQTARKKAHRDKRWLNEWPEPQGLFWELAQKLRYRLISPLSADRDGACIANVAWPALIPETLLEISCRSC